MLCSFPGCHSPVFTKKSGLCQRHYKQQRKGTLPDSREIQVGEPSGHGQYGLLDDDGMKVMCHECGEWKKSLGRHLHAIHDMTAREYKIRHGLPLGLALTGADLKARQSAESKSRLGGEAWKRLEEKRDPIAASQARDEDSFRAMSNHATDHLEKSLEALQKVTPRPMRWQTCVACGARYQSRHTTKTCGREICQDVSRYESLEDFGEMKIRAKMYEVDGMNFSQIARSRGISPQASRLSYRQWQKYQGWKETIQQENVL